MQWLNYNNNENRPVMDVAAANAKTLDEILEERLIKRVMQTAATDINLAQVSYMSSHGFSNPDWVASQKFEATESAVNYAQLLKHRFVDMKKLSKKMKKYIRIAPYL